MSSKKIKDLELDQFKQDLLESARELKSGKTARATSSDDVDNIPLTDNEWNRVKPNLKRGLNRT